MSSTLHLLVLLSIIGCVELITVTTPQKSVNVTVGQSVLLQCMFVTENEQTTSLTIQWDFDPSSSMTPEQVDAHAAAQIRALHQLQGKDAQYIHIRFSDFLVYYYQGGNDVIPKPYKGRIQVPSSPGTTRNASIIISNMQPSDAGVYTCEVHNLPDVDGQTQANVIVKVLEKPSTPYCAVHGDVESGHLVTLTCHSEQGSPKPTYTWTRLDQTKTARPVLGMTTITGKLEIRNISQFEFGEYQCNASNAVGYSVCTVELSPEARDGVIAGAVIGALLGCVLIVLVVWFIAHTVKRHKYKAVIAAEGNEMKRSSPKAHEASGSVAMTTRGSSLHAEGEEPHA